MVKHWFAVIKCNLKQKRVLLCSEVTIIIVESSSDIHFNRRIESWEERLTIHHSPFKKQLFITA
jgi:hypothetical protein